MTIVMVLTENTASLNAPYGARCFLTQNMRRSGCVLPGCLNAPYGARCFLTLRALDLATAGLSVS